MRLRVDHPNFHWMTPVAARLPRHAKNLLAANEAMPAHQPFPRLFGDGVLRGSGERNQGAICLSSPNPSKSDCLRNVSIVPTDRFRT